MKVLSETSLRELLRLIKTSFFRKSEAQEVGTIDVDDAPADGSDNLVKSGGVFNALAGKQDTISDLATIRSGAAKGATALQSFTETDPVFKRSVAWGITLENVNSWSGKQDAISDLATIRNNAAAGAAKVSCTDATVGGFGYTKNTGTYSKPTGGIPKTDLASAVQESLEKADSALQSVPSGYATEAYVDDHHDNTKQDAISDLAIIRSNALLGAAKVSCTDATVGGFGYTKNTGTYSKPSGGIPKTDLASAVQTSLGKADTALQSFTETDPVFTQSAAYGITSANITSWNGKASKPKVTSVTLNTTWTASGNNYVKTVTISGTTASSKIDVQPDPTVVERLIADGVSMLYFTNNNGTVQAVAVGAKPTTSITVQVTITEVTT